MRKPGEKVRRAFGLFAALAIMMAGCQHKPTHGTIYDMQITPAHSHTYTTLFCGSYGKYGCNVWIPLIQTEQVPTRWEICIEKDPADDSNTAPSGCLFVGSRTYGHYQIGQYYP